MYQPRALKAWHSFTLYTNVEPEHVFCDVEQNLATEMIEWFSSRHFNDFLEIVGSQSRSWSAVPEAISLLLSNGNTL